MQLDSQKQQEQKSKGRTDGTGVSFRGGETHRTCPACGAQVGATDKFCEECGAPLSSTESSEPKQTAQIQGIAPKEEKKTQTVTAAIGKEKKEGEKKADRPQGIPVIDLPKLSLKKTEEANKPKKDTQGDSEHKAIVRDSVNLPKLKLTEQVELQRTGWICNFCGCLHNKPSECSRPELGGQWQQSEKKTIAITIIK